MDLPSTSSRRSAKPTPRLFFLLLFLVTLDVFEFLEPLDCNRALSEAKSTISESHIRVLNSRVLMKTTKLFEHASLPAFSSFLHFRKMKVERVKMLNIEHHARMVRFLVL